MMNAILSQKGFGPVTRIIPTHTPTFTLKPRQDGWNDTLQPICEFHFGFPLLELKPYPGLSKWTVKGSLLGTHI